jgi:hypothetical protein
VNVPLSDRQGPSVHRPRNICWFPRKPSYFALSEKRFEFLRSGVGPDVKMLAKLGPQSGYASIRAGVQSSLHGSGRSAICDAVQRLVRPQQQFAVDRGDRGVGPARVVFKSIVG